MDLVDLLLHVDQLSARAGRQSYGLWIYAILFLIVFAETGLVVTPFLPGDSLLFAAGALAATGALDVRVAAIGAHRRGGHRRRRRELRDRPIGGRAAHPSRADGPAMAALDQSRLRRRGRTSSSRSTAARRSCSARFMPIVRTFVPFVAGVAEMSYPAFALYNVTGGVAWVGDLPRCRLRVRQRADRQGQLLAGRDRHRHRLAAADGGRVRAASTRPVVLVVSALPVALAEGRTRPTLAPRRGTPPIHRPLPPPETPAAHRRGAPGAGVSRAARRSVVVLMTTCCSRSCSTCPFQR